MKMRKISFLTLAAVALGLTACSSDEPANGGSDNNGTGERFHAKIQLKLPTTKSGTTDFDGNTNSESGFEIGKDYENQVNSVVVCLATKDASGKYKPVSVSETSAMPAAGSSETAPVYTLNFEQKEVTAVAGKTVYIFAFCNSNLTEDDITATTDLETLTASINAYAEDQAPWKKGNFEMCNSLNKVYGTSENPSYVPYVTLPSETDLKVKYNSPEKALDLGSVDVSRVVSRFDFKQKNADNTYKIFDVNLPEADRVEGKQIADVKLVGMVPVTVAKEYYRLPRVSDDGTGTNWVLCGLETNSNWVVSPNFTAKGNGSVAGLLGNYLLESTGVASYDTFDSQMTMLASFNGEDDNDENWGDNEGTGFNKEGYKIWRYVTENTVSVESAQKKGISTGVLFKAEIVNPQNEALKNAMLANKPVYSFNGVIYGSLAELRKVVVKLDEKNSLRKAFNTVFGGKAAEYLAMENGVFTVVDGSLVDCAPAENANKFKIYRPDTDGHYYVYYTYRNRHNDNGNPVEMGAMEFGTVRNNIYKLCVNNITEFGHTNVKGDDPDPENPDDPDEEPKTYFKVSVRVVPWMVRVNNIDF